MIRQEKPRKNFRRSATVRVFGVNRLAGKDRDSLFGGLEAFANLSTDAEYGMFARQWPGFFPIEVELDGNKRLGEQHSPIVEPQPEIVPAAAQLALAYSWLLRRVWVSDPEGLKYLGVLLGIDRNFLDLMEEGDVGNGPIEDRFSVAWKAVAAAYPGASIVTAPTVFPRWRSGEFTYEPGNDFQTAFYLLFRESWRAKNCAECSRNFIAFKPAQLYCSTKCSGAAKKRRDLGWWRREGASRRQEQAQRSKAHRNATNSRTERRK